MGGHEWLDPDLEAGELSPVGVLVAELADVGPVQLAVGLQAFHPGQHPGAVLEEGVGGLGHRPDELGSRLPVHGLDGQRAVLIPSLHLDVALQPVLRVEGVDLDEPSPPALVAVRRGVLVMVVMPIPGGLQTPGRPQGLGDVHGSILLVGCGWDWRMRTLGALLAELGFWLGWLGWFGWLGSGGGSRGASFPVLQEDSSRIVLA